MRVPLHRGAFFFFRSILYVMHPHLAKHLGLAAAAVALLALVIWYMALHPAPVLAPEGAATSTPLAGSGEPAHIKEDATYYEIDAAYPSSVSFPLSSRSDAGAGAQTAMKQWVITSIAEFKTNVDFSNLSPEDVQILGLDRRKYALGIAYDMYTGARTVSYVYTMHQDTGGAHSNAFYRSFTFDATTGAELSLGDLFLPSTDYPGRLSAIARMELPGKIGEFADTSFIESGTTAESESFQTFYIEGGALVIIFPPYQVGPYALGTVELPIELSRLATILKPEYR